MSNLFDIQRTRIFPDLMNGLSARHSERGKRTRRTEKKKEVGRQHQEMDRPGVRQVPDGSGEQRKPEETGCEVSCVAPTNPCG